MREMKPLLLPTIVAARKSSKGSFDMAFEPSSSVYSYADSGFYSASECSTPPTPSQSTRGHLRHPSSASSLSSSPPTYDPIELPNGSGKLPKLTEEPIEREDDFGTAIPYRCSYDDDFCDHARPPTRRSIFDRNYDFAEDCFSRDLESHAAKRRRSTESSANSITSKIERRFPSFTRKLKDRKGASTFGRASRSATPSRVSSTRSSSITSSIHQIHGQDLIERFPPFTAESSLEHLDDLVTSSKIDIAKANANALEIDVEEVERERLATTPLLPPMLVMTRFDDLPAESPLQSPTVADTPFFVDAPPVGTPPVRAYPTPTLSSKPSVSSFKASRLGHTVPLSDIPPMMLADPNDPWVGALGHANFTILPEPYMPNRYDMASLRQLFIDWEQARCNFTKHQVRTGEHHGVTSKIYLLTEKKWAEIDALWRRNNDLATSRAAAMGVELEPTSPSEPAPLSKMPTLNDPKSVGKFPKLGDEDIVGPMVQIASQVPVTPPSRKRAFFKFFSDMKFPSSLFGRPSAALRSR